ncbi:glycoside hydrolase family 3 N-terminal domain-containing protein [uncultured Brachyspira sp.]|uniref:glycoside hydrolase family 3 N-terminal domain-containing protein n=1 Tax=uncultured Brachyspira sp. TaxID=221953 RepID=UPI003458E168
MFYIFLSLIIIIMAILLCYEIKIHNTKKINNNLQIMLAVKTYDNDLINIIKDDDVKGIIINIPDINTIEKLIKNIKENLNKKIFIALDEDYKPTHNLFFDQHFKVYQSYIGERQSETYAYNIAKKRASTLKAIGVNMFLSPVVNTVCNEKSHLKEHIFSGDKQIASKLIFQTIKAYKDSGVLTAAKYFPKYYDDELYINDNIKNFEIDSKQTFLSAIDSDFFVMSHIKNEKLYRDYLFNSLNFNGVVMTDYINKYSLINTNLLNVIDYKFYKANREKIKNIKTEDNELCVKISKLLNRL